MRSVLSIAQILPTLQRDVSSQIVLDDKHSNSKRLLWCEVLTSDFFIVSFEFVICRGGDRGEALKKNNRFLLIAIEAAFVAHFR